jgi:hypothetical protein
MAVVFKNGVANSDALVTNVGARIIRGGGDQLTNYVLTLVTKRTTQRFVRAGSFHARRPPGIPQVRDTLAKEKNILIIANFRPGTEGNLAAGRGMVPAPSKPAGLNNST